MVDRKSVVKGKNNNDSCVNARGLSNKFREIFFVEFSLVFCIQFAQKCYNYSNICATRLQILLCFVGPFGYLFCLAMAYLRSSIEELRRTQLCIIKWLVRRRTWHRASVSRPHRWPKPPSWMILLNG